MITSIHQPSFFPWLGLLDKIAKSEQFIFLDDVQANKAAYQYRNTFYCNGEAKFLGLPVDYRLGVKLCDLHYKNNLWRQEHLNKLRNYYGKAPFFSEIFPLVERLYHDKGGEEKPVDFIIHSMVFVFDLFGIKVLTKRSSEISSPKVKGELVLDLCQKTATSIYLSGQGAKQYMNGNILTEFQNKEIQIRWHYFKHPVYHQSNRYPFLEGLSALDLLFFEGIERANKLFWSNINTIEACCIQ